MTSARELERRIAETTAEQLFAVHWQVRPVVSQRGAATVSDARIGQGAVTPLASFSTRKVSVLLACLALVHRGDLTLDQRLQEQLRQMMSTAGSSVQPVFDAMGAVTGDSLQWVNDYCSWAGMRSTLHREIAQRSEDLSWHHSTEHMGVTSPADQVQLLVLLGRGVLDAEAAGVLQLSTQLCRFAVEVMQQAHLPLLGASASTLRFAENSGEGPRSLAQIGLACTPEGDPAVAMAVFADNVPAQLPDGAPARLAAYDLVGQVGRMVENWYLAARRQRDHD